MKRIAQARARVASIRARRRIAAVGRGPRPVIAGPWRSEVGFELLYWIPFLRWFAAEHELAREDVVAVSRGGADSWYSEIAGTYLDLLEWQEPADLIDQRAERIAARASEKQSTLDEADVAAVALARSRLGANASGLLHPSLMYRLFHVGWIAGSANQLASNHLRHAPIVPPPLDGLDVPASYVALKAYFSDCFPDSDRNRAFLDRLVVELAEQSAVVVLRPPTAFDDHTAYVPASAPGVVDVSSLLSDPRRNLAVQTAIVGGARGLVTTYGGFAYLGPLLGCATRSFYSVASFDPAHVSVALAAAGELGATPADATPVHVDDYAPPT